MEHIEDQKIEAYIRDKMTLEERRRFEADIAADPELRRRVDALRRLAEDIRQIARADTRRRVEATRDKITVEEQTPKEPRLPAKRWRWFLGGLLLAGLLWLGYRYFSPVDPKEGGGTHPAGTRDTLTQQPAGPVAEIPDAAEIPDELGQSAVTPFTTETVEVLDASGNKIGRTIRVEHYRDTTRLYIFRDNILELYIPPGKDLSGPTVLTARNGRLYLRVSRGNEVHLEATNNPTPF